LVGAGALVGAGGATVVATPQADNSMLANITRLKTMVIFLFILISSKKDLGTTGILFLVSRYKIDQTLYPKESYLQVLGGVNACHVWRSCFR
jgi:hypothetical protein